MALSKGLAACRATHAHMQLPYRAEGMEVTYLSFREIVFQEGNEHGIGGRLYLGVPFVRNPAILLGACVSLRLKPCDVFLEPFTFGASLTSSDGIYGVTTLHLAQPGKDASLQIHQTCVRA